MCKKEGRKKNHRTEQGQEFQTSKERNPTKKRKKVGNQEANVKDQQKQQIIKKEKTERQKVREKGPLGKKPRRSDKRKGERDGE